MNKSPHFNFAVRMGHLMHGVSDGEFAEKRAFAEALDQSPAVGRMVCKLAAALYEAAGKTAQFQYHLYDKLSKEANWHPSYNEFVEPVVESLAHVIGEMEQEELTKRAGLLTPYVAGEVAGHGLALSPAVMKWLAAAGIGTGAAVGGLGWYANRDINEDETDLEAMQARSKNYQRITKEISDALRSKGKLPVTRDVEDIIEDTADAPIK